MVTVFLADVKTEKERHDEVYAKFFPKVCAVALGLWRSSSRMWRPEWKSSW